jgi:hypothetical protein
MLRITFLQPSLVGAGDDDRGTMVHRPAERRSDTVSEGRRANLRWQNGGPLRVADQRFRGSFRPRGGDRYTRVDGQICSELVPGERNSREEGQCPAVFVPGSV